MEGTDKSHAKDPQFGSVGKLPHPFLNTSRRSPTDRDPVPTVPQAAQEKLPKGVEQAVPDSLHDTGSSKDISGGDSIVPKAVAESLPKGVQEAVPDAM